MIFFLSPQVYLVFRSGKALEDNSHNKSSGAKFISRTQIRTFASASSVNASSGQVTHNDNRLSESEAVDEMKQLAMQLQRLYDRIPRGPISNVILTLLDICKSVQQPNNQITLKPPTQTVPVKRLSICDRKFVDKETSTSFENLVLQQHTIECPNSCKCVISDKCDNHLVTKNSRNNKIANNNHNGNRCCSNYNPDQIMCSTNSINFDNLQLQCMCSSDNNSIEEYQIENCDNCNSSYKPDKNVISNTSSSFREKLLSQTAYGHDRMPLGLRLSNNSNPQRYSNISEASSSLTKRNSELMLGTQFDPTFCQQNRNMKIGKSYDSCDNIYVNKQPISECVKMNSNYSLSYEAGGPSCYQKAWEPSYEQPPLKLSHSEDDNLKELKIALSSSLITANGQNSCAGNSNQAQQPQIQQQKSQQQRNRIINSGKPAQHSQSYTSSSSSSKIDKISLSLSTSSTSDALAKRLHQQQSITDDNELGDSSETDGAKQQRSEIVREDGKENDAKDTTISTSSNNHNEMNKNNIIEPSSANNNKVSEQPPPPLNNSLSHAANNSTTNANGKKRKMPEGKLTLDLNDRSKYGEEVSV